MKKKLLLLISGMYLAWNANAQISQGGFPLSMRSSNIEIPIREYKYPALDWEAIKQEVSNRSSIGESYLVAKAIPSDIKFPESGTLIKNEDGTYIWKVMANVPGAKGLLTYCKEFNLPQGVSLFIHNKNKRHVLGAFTSQNNDESTLRSVIDAVQGDEAYIELNIPSYVTLSDIHFSIEKFGAIFRGFEDLDYFISPEDRPLATGNEFFGQGSVCMILANCAPYYEGKEIQRDATVFTIVENSDGMSACSGTMVNNTGNTATNCTRYLLTASHCESDGSTGGAPFTSGYLVRFKYEHPGCEWLGTAPTPVKSINKVTFVSRSVNPSSPGAIKADFLLLKLTSVPGDVNAQLNGWNRTPSPVLKYTSPKKFYGFHHPGGDVKSYSSSQEIESVSVGASSTHWRTQLLEGYIAGGSSGSGLFDNEGYLIGIASVAPDGVAPASCLVDHKGNPAERTTSVISYSKLSYCWENPGDDGASTRKLQPWLDPAGTGAMKLGPTDASCSTMSTKDFVAEFNVTMNLFPNPSNDGKFNISIKLNDATDLKFEIFDIAGRKIMHKDLPGLKDQTASIDLSAYASGIYYVKLSNAFGFTSQKIVITK